MDNSNHAENVDRLLAGAVFFCNSLFGLNNLCKANAAWLRARVGPVLAGVIPVLTPGAVCSACIPHPTFCISFHLLHLLWGKNKDDSRPKLPVGSISSVLSQVVSVFGR